MADWAKWFFDGIGTELVSIVIGLIIGGAAGFVIGRRTKSKQVQKAKNNAKQKQNISYNCSNSTNIEPKNETQIIEQKQKGGDHSEQIQRGSIKYGQR